MASLLRTLCALFLAGFAGLGCSSSEPSDPEGAPPDESGDVIEYELFESTRLLEDETLESLASSAADGTLRFDGTPEALADVEPGAILLGGISEAEPGGLLRYVVSVDDDGGDLVLGTVGVMPQVAFRFLHAEVARTIEDVASEPFDDRDLRPLTLGGGSASQSIDVSIFDGDGDESTTEDQVRLVGELGGGFDYFLGIDIDWGEVDELPTAVGECLAALAEALVGEEPDCSLKALLPELRVGYEVQAAANATLDLTGVAYAGYEGEYILADIPIEPSFFMVGPIPFTVGLKVVAHLSGGASSQFGVSTGASFLAGNSLYWSSKNGVVEQPPTVEPSFDPPSIEAALGAQAKASVGPELAIKVLGFMGPTAALEVFTSVQADVAADPCFTVNAGADLRVGFEIGVNLPVLGAVELGKYSKAYTLIDEELESGSCEIPEGASELPPGAGPDAAHLAEPDYTPWSKTFSGALDHMVYSNASLDWTEIEQTIDGRYVVSGPGMQALVKFDGDGTLVWAKRYEIPEVYREWVLPGSVVPTADANLFVTASGTTSRYSILKVGQGGGLIWAENFPDVTAGEDRGPNGDLEEVYTFHAALSDEQGGLYVAGSVHPPETEAEGATVIWLLHLGPDGEVLWSKSIGVDGSRLYPRALAPTDDGFVVTGFEWTGDSGEDGRRGFVLRIDGAGEPAWARRWTGCGPSPTLELNPITAIRTASGNTLIAGSLGVYLRSFVALVRPDGSIAVQSNPYSGSDLSYMVIHSIRELPTSGFLAVGNYTDGFELDSTFLAGLDSTGHLQWLEQYLLPVTDPGSETGYSAVHPTDDGGALIAAYTSAPTDGDPSLWAFKPFAKDGAIEFTGGAEHVTQAFVDGGCDVLDSELEVTVSDFPATPAPLALDVVDAEIIEDTQAP